MTEDLIIYRKTIPGSLSEYAKIPEKNNSTDFRPDSILSYFRTEWKVLLAVTEPQMLFFDEITANLGAETEKEVLQALKRVAKRKNSE
nr:hypothetical protein [uncultured Blautia sp.]